MRAFYKIGKNKSNLKVNKDYDEKHSHQWSGYAEPKSYER